MSSTSGTGARPMRLTMDEAIEHLGFGRFQVRLVMVSGLCTAADAIEVLLLTFLTLIVKAEWGLTGEQAAVVTSVVFIGALIGTLILGPLADAYGRKPIFVASNLLIAIFGVATTMAVNYWLLVLCRFGVGLGIGGIVVPFDTLAEYMPASHRAKMLLSIGYFWTIGTMIVPGIAYVALYDHGSWRLLVLICSLPCICSTILTVWWVPESPRWLAVQGRNDEALAILRWGATVNGRDPMEVFPEDTVFVHEENKDAELHSVHNLLQKKYRTLNLVLWGVWAGLSFMYWGTTQIVTLIFKNKTYDEMNPYDFDYAAIVVAASAELVGQTMVILFIDRIGRKCTQSSMYFFCAISVTLLCMVAYQGSITTDRATLIALAFLSRMFAMGASSSTWVITAEALPQEIRSTGHSFANAVARIGGACTPFLASPDNSMRDIGIVMGSIGLWATLMSCLLPETKGVDLGTAAKTDELRPVKESEII